MEYRVISNRITAVENDQVLGEITFPVCGPETVVIDHTWVDPSLRGQGTAGQLMQAVVDKLRADGRKAQATCSYARGGSPNTLRRRMSSQMTGATDRKRADSGFERHPRVKSLQNLPGDGNLGQIEGRKI